MVFCLFRQNCPCEDPVAGLQGREPVQREEPGAGSRIRSARCGAHVHTVQQMRNASCEYGHGSFSFHLDFHLGLAAWSLRLLYTKAGILDLQDIPPRDAASREAGKQAGL